MKKILLLLTIIIIINCQNNTKNNTKNNTQNDALTTLAELLGNDDSSADCEIGEYYINGTCKRCEMEDNCFLCDFETNECLACTPPYKLDGKKCKLSSKTITWIILMYLLVIVIVSILIVILVLPKLN